jgi:hypothetical protein
MYCIIPILFYDDDTLSTLDILERCGLNNEISLDDCTESDVLFYNVDNIYRIIEDDFEYVVINSGNSTFITRLSLKEVIEIFKTIKK